MRTLTIQCDGMRITVREALGSDVFDEDIVFINLGSAVEGHPKYRVDQFVQAVVRTVDIDSDGAPFIAWPAVTDARRMVQAYEDWRKLPRRLLEQWANGLAEVNQPPGDPAEHPQDIPVGEASRPT